MTSEVERALEDVRRARVRLVATMGATRSEKIKIRLMRILDLLQPAHKAQNSLKSGEIVVVDGGRVDALGSLLACIMSTLSGCSDGMIMSKQAARVYGRLIDMLGPVITGEDLRAYLRGDDGE